MWFWYLLGYVITGFIAIFGWVAWFLVATPVRNEYDLDHWLDHSTEALHEVLDELIGPQTRMEDVIGAIITMFTWPVKLVWISREVYPRIVERYEELLNQ